MIVVVLALLVAAGVTSQTSGASGTVMAAPDVAAAVDEASDVDPAITETPVVFETPARRQLRQFAASFGESTGRLHRISIFRPPCGFASR